MIAWCKCLFPVEPTWTAIQIEAQREVRRKVARSRNAVIPSPGSKVAGLRPRTTDSFGKLYVSTPQAASAQMRCVRKRNKPKQYLHEELKTS